MVVSTHFQFQKGVKRGLKNGALPFKIDSNAQKRLKKRSIAVHQLRRCVTDHLNSTKNGACPFTRKNRNRCHQDACDRKTEHVRSLLCSFYVIVCGRTNIQHVTMAGKTKDMSQIKQLLLLKKEGVSNRKAAEIVGINKETANNYVRKALADRLGIDDLLKLDDPVLEHRLKGGNSAYTDMFKELLPYLQEEMRRKHVTLKLLWEASCFSVSIN